MTGNPLERFKGILAAIAVTRPGLPLEEALQIAAQVELQMMTADWASALNVLGAPVPDDSTPVEIAAAWCREQPAVVDHIVAGRLINAIKEVRALSGMSLKQAKEACEYMRAHLLP